MIYSTYKNNFKITSANVIEMRYNINKIYIYTFGLAIFLYLLEFQHNFLYTSHLIVMEFLQLNTSSNILPNSPSVLSLVNEIIISLYFYYIVIFIVYIICNNNIQHVS
jgi:hypothetical protein